MTSTELAVENCDELAAYNGTELYQLARCAHLHVSPTMSKQELVDALEGVDEPDQVCELDPYRGAIMQVLLAYWTSVSSQLFCPAKSKDPKACYACPDSQVVCCLEKNQAINNKVLAYLRKMSP